MLNTLRSLKGLASGGPGIQFKAPNPSTGFLPGLTSLANSLHNLLAGLSLLVGGLALAIGVLMFGIGALAGSRKLAHRGLSALAMGALVCVLVFAWVGAGNIAVGFGHMVG